MVHLLSAATAPATTTTAAGPLVIGPFVLLLLAIPVLLFGEQLIKSVRWLARSNIPAPIIGGLIVAIGLLILNEIHPGALAFQEKTTAIAWLWTILPQWNFGSAPATSIDRPLLILFFTCIGLNASWAVAKKGSWQLLLYLAISTAFALVMLVVGVLTAKMIGQDPLLGMMCSGVSLMGGFGTAAGFAPEFEKAGLNNAAAIGVAAAAFGVIGGGLIAGPVTGRLIEKHVPGTPGTPPLPFAERGFEVIHEAPVVAASDADPAKPVIAAVSDPESMVDEGGFIDDIRNMVRDAGPVLLTLLCLLFCLKIGAFVSQFIAARGITFPVYMGSMLVAAVFRNIHDLAGGNFIKSVRVDLIASFALAWLLSVVMINLKLGELIHSAGPMLVILAVQSIIICLFAYWVIFKAMGRDYEAAAMSAGFIGFALGATSNAVATMRQINRRYGPSPRAFLIVTVVGAFLIDFTNAICITTFLNVFRH